MTRCVEFSRLFPLKKEVVTALAEVLDHPKRAVRKSAAAARNDWCANGSKEHLG